MDDKEKKIMAEEKLTSKQLLGELLQKHYAEAMEAKAQGKPVVWSTSIAPQELLEAMDLTVVYPGESCSSVASRKDAPQFIDKSEGDGYSRRHLLLCTCQYRIR